MTLSQAITSAGLDLSRMAATKAVAASDNDQDRSVALNELGDVLITSGIPDEARVQFEQSLEIAEKIDIVGGEPTDLTQVVESGRRL